MESKKKIIFYIDWTDCLAHLTGDNAYAEGDTDEDKRNYTRRQVNHFFKALKNLQNYYDVDIHCITGGTREYLNGDGHGWISLIHELFESAGCSDVFKSVVTEYGGDMLIGKNCDFLECDLEDAKAFCTNKMLDDIRKTLPDEIVDKVELSLCKYYANVRFEKEDMTEEEFNYYYSLIKSFKNSDAYSIYPYYCPGYGVEMDILPNGFDKTRAVSSINSVFYDAFSREDIALSVFNGDFSQIDLRMVDESLSDNVLFVGSEDADIKPYVQDSELSYRTVGHKIEAISMAMEEIAAKGMDLSSYNKGGYRYAK